MASVPHLDVFFDFGKLDEVIVHSVVDVVRPQWAGRLLVLSPVVGGNLNKNYRIHPEGAANQSVFLHVINPIATPMIPNHLKVCRLLSKNKIGPELYATFENGTCTEYLNGYDLEQSGKRELLRKSEWIKQSAYQLARFHCRSLFEQAMEMDIDKNLMFFMPELVKEYWHNVPANERMPEELRVQLPNTDQLITEFYAGADLVQSLDCEMVLCHADYNPSNMMITENGSFVVVDFDGCLISYAPYDLAYFFLFVFNDHFNPTEKFVNPPDEYYHNWCRSYLESRVEIDGCGSASEESVKKLVFQVKKTMLCILIRLTISSAMLSFMGPSAQLHQMENFLKFSLICWREYLRTKDYVRALKLDEET